MHLHCFFRSIRISIKPHIIQWDPPYSVFHLSPTVIMRPLFVSFEPVDLLCLLSFASLFLPLSPGHKIMWERGMVRGERRGGRSEKEHLGEGRKREERERLLMPDLAGPTTESVHRLVDAPFFHLFLLSFPASPFFSFLSLPPVRVGKNRGFLARKYSETLCG